MCGVRFRSIAELNRTQSTDWVRLSSIEFDFRTFDLLRRALETNATKRLIKFNRASDKKKEEKISGQSDYYNQMRMPTEMPKTHQHHLEEKHPNRYD